jgi:16S rRNA (cytosine967-C5)-methyltransferase
MTDSAYNRIMTNHAPALSNTLLAAAYTLADVESGRSLTEALAHIPSDLRPSTQALAFYAMRHWGMARGLCAVLVQRAPPNPIVPALLGLSLVLLDAAMQSRLQPAPAGTPIYTEHTLVDQSVIAMQSQRDLTSYKGMVNAVLRRFQRERNALMAKLSQNLEARWNHPAWWVHRLRKTYPETWQSILQASNTPPPLTLRVNTRRASVESVCLAFTAAGIDCVPVGLFGVIVREPRGITTLPGYQEGWWSVQDAGAQLAAPLLAVTDGMRVLDACAAPGGKAAHLLELARLYLTAIDLDETRLSRVSQNLARLGLQGEHVRLLSADATTNTWWDGKPYDAILADVPCTASGIVRRHPDIRWLRQEKDIDRLARSQREILDRLWTMLAPGGKLLLVTCSVFVQEGETQAQNFLSRHKDAFRLEAPGQLLPEAGQGDNSSDHDGFFYALFRRDQV